MSATTHHATDPAPPDRPLRRDAERNRQRIVQAAREVFASRGLSAGLNDIAHHAGLGVGTVYRHFPNKDVLIETALRERVAAMLVVAEEGRANADAWQGLTRIMRTFAEMQVADRGLRDVALGSEFGQQEMDDLRARIAPVVEQVLMRAQAAGDVRRGVTVGDLVLVLFMVTELARHSSEDEPAAYRRYLDVFLQGLRPTTVDADLEPALSEPGAEAIIQNWVASGVRRAADG